MLFDTREEADDYIAQLTKGMIVVDTGIVDGVEKTVYALETNGLDEPGIEVNIAPPGTVLSPEIMDFLRDEEDGVELIFGDLEDYTSERIVIVSDIKEGTEPSPDALDDEVVDPDQLP